MQTALEPRFLSNRRKKRVRHKLRVVNRANHDRIYFNATNKYLYAQLIETATGKTIALVTSKKIDGAKKNISAAEKLADLFAQKLEEKKVTAESVFVFDRGSRQYHGRVKAFAEKLREKGFKF